MKVSEISVRISVAKTSLDEAERSLTEALAEIRAAPRAEKTTVSIAVEEAFERLRAARAILAGLELSESEDDDGSA